MIKILEKLYQQTSLTYEEESFQTSSGVRKGEPESPFLFKLYLDFVMRLVLEKSHPNDDIKFFNHKYRITSRFSISKLNCQIKRMPTIQRFRIQIPGSLSRL